MPNCLYDGLYICVYADVGVCLMRGRLKPEKSVSYAEYRGREWAGLECCRNLLAGGVNKQ